MSACQNVLGKPIETGNLGVHATPDGRLHVQARKRPAAELAVDGRPLPDLRRQVAPLRTRSRDPENAPQNKAMVDRLPPIRGTHRKD